MLYNDLINELLGLNGVFHGCLSTNGCFNGVSWVYNQRTWDLGLMRGISASKNGEPT